MLMPPAEKKTLFLQGLIFSCLARCLEILDMKQTLVLQGDYNTYYIWLDASSAYVTTLLILPNSFTKYSLP